uniref:Uncharacterized protein n=1 Tax=Cannabis sativa TaxID=3483 RepID=A0A803RB13_CANSA
MGPFAKIVSLTRSNDWNEDPPSKTAPLHFILISSTLFLTKTPSPSPSPPSIKHLTALSNSSPLTISSLPLL